MAPVSMEVRLDQIAESIDRLITTELEARPNEARGRIHYLYEAAREQCPRPLAMAAAEALRAAAASGRPVVVSSGWVIDFWLPRGEMCGIVGAAALARTITQGLRVPVVFLGEEPVLPVYEAICLAADMRVYPYEKRAELPNVITARTFPIDPAEAEREATRFLDAVQP